MRTQYLAQGIHSRTSTMQRRVEDIAQGVGSIQTDMSRHLEQTIRANAQNEASTEATKNLASILQGIIDFAECGHFYVFSC